MGRPLHRTTCPPPVPGRLMRTASLATAAVAAAAVARAGAEAAAGAAVGAGGGVAPAGGAAVGDEVYMQMSRATQQGQQDVDGKQDHGHADGRLSGAHGHGRGRKRGRECGGVHGRARGREQGRGLGQGRERMQEGQVQGQDDTHSPMEEEGAEAVAAAPGAFRMLCLAATAAYAEAGKGGAGSGAAATEAAASVVGGSGSSPAAFSDAASCCSACGVRAREGGGAGVVEMMVCGHCLSVFYCSVECQQRGWERGHQRECPLLRLAARRGAERHATAEAGSS